MREREAERARPTLNLFGRRRPGTPDSDSPSKSDTSSVEEQEQPIKQEQSSEQEQPFFRSIHGKGELYINPND